MQILFTMLGGAGYELPVGERVCADFLTDRLNLTTKTGFDALIHYLEIADLSITGPGSVTTGGGFLGGGFGGDGALVGLGIASVLNAITSETKINTYLNLITDSGEIYLHCGTLEPGALRIFLAPTFTAIRNLDSEWINIRMKRIETHRAKNLISEDDYLRIKARLDNRNQAALSEYGFKINALTEGGTARVNGAKVGDIILRYGTKTIHSDSDLADAISAGHLNPYLLVLRNGQLLKLNVAPGRLGIEGEVVKTLDQ